MKRLIFATMLLASLPASPASEGSKLTPFERGSWQQLLRSHAGRPTFGAFLGRDVRAVQGRIT